MKFLHQEPCHHLERSARAGRDDHAHGAIGGLRQGRRTREREHKLMKKIDDGLARIEDGSYGWCEETGEPIGIPRLLARPTATLSFEAQQRRELKQKMYGD